MSQLDFFQRQEIARRNTKRLTLYFGLGVLGTVLLTYLAVAFIFAAKVHTGLWNPPLFAGVAAVTLCIIIGGSFFKTAQLASGGSAVATMLGGRPVDSFTSDPGERKLLNVVEEMAIASGTPVPAVYVLPNENGINAFAAGHSTKDMVVCATRGSLEQLNRDELQGVIGHEFSHILNGDMALNLRLMGLIFGLVCLAIFGRILLYTRGRKNPLPALGFALLIIGGLGVFFGKLIKSAVSRQREFLADASSVQFTRNPAGLASALKKVGYAGSRIDDPNAEDASHFFFANGLNESLATMFSTHPPLEERIRALDTNWDGQFTPTTSESEITERAAAAAPPRIVRPPQMGDLLGGRFPQPVGAVIGGAILAQSGAPTARHLEYAAGWRANLAPEIEQAAREPMSAVSLIYALLLSRDDSLRAKQLEQLQIRADPGICQETTNLFSCVAALDAPTRLPLASLTMTALRGLSAAQYEQFAANMKFIIESDQKIELFEYALQKIVLRQLEPTFKPSRRPVIQFYVIKPLLPDCAVLLSALAYVGNNTMPLIEAAFQQGASRLGVPGILLLKPDSCGLALVETALNRLNQATPQVKNIVLNACAETVAADGVIRPSEAELLRAIADTLDCPIPPFLTV